MLVRYPPVFIIIYWEEIQVLGELFTFIFLLKHYTTLEYNLNQERKP